MSWLKEGHLAGLAIAPDMRGQWSRTNSDCKM
jgi:hypothetical protein